MRKNIDLPMGTIKILQQMAQKDGRKLKPFMELLLIREAKKYAIKKLPENSNVVR